MSKKIKKPPIAVVKAEYPQLRTAAEKFLDGNSLINSSEYNKEIKELFQELQVHQIELEMQNDELKIANLELEHQKAKFFGMYDLAPVGYFVLDNTGVIKDVNDTGTSMLDTVKEHILGMRLRTFITNDSSDAYYRFFMHMLKFPRVQRCNLDIKALNGTIVHTQLGGVARNIGDGPIECYIAIVDISERIKAEQEMAEIKDRLELSLKASLAGTWELDVETMNFFLDEGSQRICNVPLTGFAGNFQDFLLLIHHEDRTQVELSFSQSLKDHKEIDLNCRLGNSDDQECYAVIRGHLISPAGSAERYAGIILDITEKTQMEKYSNQLREEYQKKIASAMITTEENERKRISESLHDSVSQLLYGIQIQLGQLEKTVPDSSNIKSVKKLLDQAIDETRNISFELAPSILTDFGLSTTIEELVKRLSSQDLKMKVSIRGLFKRLDLLLETNIYRIVQELVNNSMKHSGADQITIDITKDQLIEIIVKDNGKGYSVPDQENYTCGAGLSSIRNRLRIYNGNMTIESEPGIGTTVHVKLMESVPEQGLHCKL